MNISFYPKIFSKWTYPITESNEQFVAFECVFVSEQLNQFHQRSTISKTKNCVTQRYRPILLAGRR